MHPAIKLFPVPTGPQNKQPTSKKFRDNIHAKGTDIAVLSSGDSDDYISLTDIARYKSDAPDDVIKNWMRNRDTIDIFKWQKQKYPDRSHLT